jgi:hypothetical protein
MVNKFYCVRCKKAQDVHDVKKYKALKNGAEMLTGIDNKGHKLYKIRGKK